MNPIIQNSASRALLPGHAIGWSLYNSDDQAVLFISDDPRGHALNLEVTNISEQRILVPPLPGNPHQNNFHFALRFRLGAIAIGAGQHPPEISATLPQGWSMSGGSLTPEGLEYYFTFSGPTSFNWEPGNPLHIGMMGLRAAETGGTRGTQAELRFTKFYYEGRANEMLQGFRRHLLNIVNHRWHRNLPLEFAWHGSNTLLNNGTPQELDIRISSQTGTSNIYFNSKPHSPSRIIFRLDPLAHEQNQLVPRAEWNSLGFHFLQTPESRPGPENQLDFDADKDGWVLDTQARNIPNLSSGHELRFSLQVSTISPAGSARLIIAYEDFPDYWNGQRELFILKTPMVHHHGRTGIGTSNPSNTLEIQGSSRRSNAGEDSVLLQLNDTQQGEGNRTNYSFAISRQDGDTNALMLGTNEQDDALFVANNRKLVFGRAFEENFYPLMELSDSNGAQGAGVSERPKLHLHGEMQVEEQVEFRAGVKVETETETANLKVGNTATTGQLSVLQNGEVNGNLNVQGKIEGQGAFVKGMIIMWWGKKLPKGWKLCDGNNGTPNLKDKFVYGADGAEFNEKNAEPKFTYGGAGTVKLTKNNLPSHSHSGTTKKDGSHQHISFYRTSGVGGNYEGFVAHLHWGANKEDSKTHNDGAHQHQLQIDPTGGGEAFDILPPHVRLAYIMYLGE